MQGDGDLDGDSGDGGEWLWERKQVGIGGDVGVEVGVC